MTSDKYAPQLVLRSCIVNEINLTAQYTLFLRITPFVKKLRNLSSCYYYYFLLSSSSSFWRSCLRAIRLSLLPMPNWVYILQLALHMVRALSLGNLHFQGWLISLDCGCCVALVFCWDATSSSFQPLLLAYYYWNYFHLLFHIPWHSIWRSTYILILLLLLDRPLNCNEHSNSCPKMSLLKCMWTKSWNHHPPKLDGFMK